MTIKTSGGASIYYFNTDKFKTTTVSVNIYRPLENEAAKNALLTRVLKAASEKYASKSEIEKYLEWMYGASFIADVSKKGEMQVLTFEVKAPSDKYTGECSSENAANFLKEIIYNPKIADNKFDDDIFEIEKENLKNLMYAFENDKREFATQRCIEEMCITSGYRIPKLGTVAQLEPITNEELFGHYQKIIETSKIDIFVFGDCNINNIKSIFEAVKSTDNVIKGIPMLPRSSVKEIHEIMNVNQGKLVMGMTIDADFYTAVMFNSIYGSSTHSKLFNNVREKLSLAYYAYSRYIRQKSMIIVGSGIEFNKYDVTRAEVKNQLEEMQHGNISDFEIEAAQKFIENMYMSMNDDTRGMIDFYVTQNVCGDSDSIEDFIKGIKSVTKDEIISAANSVKLHTTYFLKGLN